MRVGCNLLWLVPGMVGGTETATVSLLRQIAAEPPDGIDISVYALDAFGQSYPDVVEAFPTQLVPLTGRLRPLRVGAENSWLARQTRGQVDLVHHMGGVLPLVRGAPGVLTIHDLQPFDLPGNFLPHKRAYLQRSIPRSVRAAASVVAPTQFVRQGLVDRFGVAPERVLIAPWGVEPASTDVSVAQVQARYGLPRRWFVFPSFTWNHKNHGLLLRAFATVAAREHDVMLVLTGGEGPAEQAVVDQISRLGLRGRVRRTGLIPRRDVLAIVRGAVAMTFPSQYEGFGLPVLEAMSLGTPVVSSDAAALPEVVGGAGRVVPVDDADAWVEEMTRMLDDGDERQRLADAGRVRVEGFTWQRTASQTLAAYRAAVTPSPSAAAATGAAAAATGADASTDAAAATDEPAVDGTPDDGVAP
ncbi:MAG: glycosyltransferase family 4 protein [Acidimicrobiales bacterium]|nr:glycosyltransferase family 4 protein [Acidimicrobiales bacterium]